MVCPEHREKGAAREHSVVWKASSGEGSSLAVIGKSERVATKRCQGEMPRKQWQRPELETMIGSHQFKF